MERGRSTLASERRLRDARRLAEIEGSNTGPKPRAEPPAPRALTALTAEVCVVSRRLSELQTQHERVLARLADEQQLREQLEFELEEERARQSSPAPEPPAAVVVDVPALPDPRVEELQAANERLREQLQQLQEYVDPLREQLRKQHARLHAEGEQQLLLQDQHRADAEGALAQARRELQGLHSKASAAQARAVQLDSRLVAEVRNGGELAEQLRRREAEVLQLSRVASATKDAFRSRISDVEAGTQALRHATANAEARVAEQHGEVRALKRALASREDELAEAGKEKRPLLASVAQLRARVATLQSERGDLLQIVAHVVARGTEEYAGVDSELRSIASYASGQLAKRMEASSPSTWRHQAQESTPSPDSERRHDRIRNDGQHGGGGGGGLSFLSPTKSIGDGVPRASSGQGGSGGGGRQQPGRSSPLAVGIEVWDGVAEVRVVKAAATTRTASPPDDPEVSLCGGGERPASPNWGALEELASERREDRRRKRKSGKKTMQRFEHHVDFFG